ncbi:H-NS histone family protein [Candidatus Parcubacteria bacterium]|nr:MAG: H-NS histone family protein [Candidatus Parcubacteria bacterium]
MNIEAELLEKRKLLRKLEREVSRLEELKQKQLKVTSPEVKEIARSIQELARDRNMEADAVLDLVMQAIERYPFKGKRGGTRGIVPPKYRNPDNPAETWTGRGRKPKWVEEALNQGKTLDDLLIRSNNGTETE